jgi:hypothetical protein
LVVHVGAFSDSCPKSKIRLGKLHSFLKISEWSGVDSILIAEGQDGNKLAEVAWPSC